MAWIDLEGAVNVRDLGGLPTVDGGSIVPGRLLRSENLQELSSADIAKLVKEIGVTTVVDLRTTGELEVEGPAPLDAVPAVRHVHRPILKELETPARRPQKRCSSRSSNATAPGTRTTSRPGITSATWKSALTR